MNLLNIAEMLADVLDFEDVYGGNIDANLDCCVGVYKSKNNNSTHKICIGGKACTKTIEKSISILIHWTDNPTIAEEKATEILESITNIREYISEEFVIHFLKCSELIPVGKDDRGICEYVIEAKIYFERKI